MTSPSTQLWRGRLGTLNAFLTLSVARAVVRFIPFHHWKQSLGQKGTEPPSASLRVEAQRLATLVDRAAVRSPGTSKCLPRAVAVSWLLRRRRIPHVLVFAARPEPLRGGPDTLHAWVEVGDTKIVGDLPGPWIETLRLGA